MDFGGLHRFPVDPLITTLVSFSWSYQSHGAGRESGLFKLWSECARPTRRSQLGLGLIDVVRVGFHCFGFKRKVVIYDTHYFINPWVVWSILPQLLSFQESSLSMQTTNKEKQNHEKLCLLEIREHRPMWVAHYTTDSPCETF